MIVDIRFQKETTLIVFKGKDFTSHDDILTIASSLAAGGYCFEAGTLLSPSFGQFVEGVKPRSEYGVLVGRDAEGKPFVRWGKMEKAPAGLPI